MRSGNPNNQTSGYNQLPISNKTQIKGMKISTDSATCINFDQRFTLEISRIAKGGLTRVYSARR